MGVPFPRYLDINAILGFLQDNIDDIRRFPDTRTVNAFLELRMAIIDYRTQQQEKSERELLAKLKAKYEASEKTNNKKEYFLTKYKS